MFYNRTGLNYNSYYSAIKQLLLNFPLRAVNMKSISFWVATCVVSFSCSAGWADSPSLVADAAELAQRGAVLRMLNEKANVNAPQADGMTALHWSVHNDDLEMTQALLAAGADVKAKNRYEVTPLSLACTNGNAAIVGALLERGAEASTALPGGESALMTASRTGNLKCVQLLLEKGANPNAHERKGQSAIMWAAAEGYADVVEELIKAGADPNDSLPSGFNPLFFAVRAGKTSVVELLLSKGVDVNQVLKSSGSGKAARKGTAALMLAVENGHFELAIRLVDAGANPNDERSGYTVLHALSWVRKPNRGDGDDGDPAPMISGKLESLQFVRELVARGANVNQRLERGASGRGKLSRQGATPLMMAAVTADLPLMKTLVELGGDPLIPNEENATTLMAAAGVGSLAPGEEAGTESEVLECLDYLLERGLDLNAKDDHGETAMHGAAYKSLPQVVAYLAERGARVDVWNSCNEYGWTPLSIASGTRVGNFKPAPDTMAAIEAVLAQAGVKPVAPKAASFDIYQVKNVATKQAVDGKVNTESPLATELKSIVETQAASWNRGDIPAFMDAYWRSEKLTFSSGGKTTRGWEATRDQYLKKYPDRATMGTLKFTELEVQSLDDHAALMLGRWHLSRDQPVGGNFSLVWQKIDGKWVIVHDHSSSDAPKE
jgi:ankyrin repeat protein/ketosteroid isomerase-like protein